MKVLVVEDNPISSKVVESTLKKHNYRILVARDGQQAIEQLESYPEIEAMITDIVMPNTSGFEMLEFLARRQDWRELPVVVCTSVPLEQLKNEGLPAYSLQYLPKPISPELLLHKLRQATAQRPKFLEDADSVISRLQCEPQDYCDMIDEFRKLLLAKIDELEQQTSKSSCIDVRDLIEGGRVIGAQRLVHALEWRARARKVADGAKDESLDQMLLRELKGLRNFLNEANLTPAGVAQNIEHRGEQRFIPRTALESKVGFGRSF